MKKIIASVFFSFILVSAFAQDLKLDRKSSKIVWEGKKVIGGSHEGLIDAKSGSLVIKKNKPVSGELVIDLNSLTCTDIEDKEYNGKLLGHLKSPDFFDTKKFPEAKFMISKIIAKGNSSYLVRGKLTIKGITKPAEFNATIIQSEQQTSARGLLIVDRSQFDVKYGSNSFFDDLKDKAIDDNFYIDFDLVFKK